MEQNNTFKKELKISAPPETYEILEIEGAINEAQKTEKNAALLGGCLILVGSFAAMLNMKTMGIPYLQVLQDELNSLTFSKDAIIKYYNDLGPACIAFLSSGITALMGSLLERVRINDLQSQLTGLDSDNIEELGGTGNEPR